MITFAPYLTIKIYYYDYLYCCYCNEPINNGLAHF